MFKLSLKKEKNALTHLVKINKDFVFAPGVICALHPGLYAFAALKNKNVDTDEPVLRDCSFMEDIVKSREIDEMEFNIQSAEFKTKKPYKYHSMMTEKEDGGASAEEVMKRLSIIEGISELDENSVFTKSDGEEKRIAFFEVDNGVFIDMLQRLGEEENVKLSTGDELRVENSKTFAAMEFSAPMTEVSVVLTEDTLPVLKNSFLGDEESSEKAERPKSKICIIDETSILVLNRASTIINSMV